MSKRAEKKPKITPKWKLVEEVAALIEKTLDPSAEVEHDVELQDLTTPGLKRQCDVVVTTGPAHRRIRTIVEVQRRERKVEIGHFDSWLAKMRAVGAQQLVCVSTTGYPESIKAKAAQVGPTARLATLKELQKNSEILRGAFGQLNFQLQQGGSIGYKHIEFMCSNPRAGGLDRQIDFMDPVFRRANGEIVSLNRIVQAACDAIDLTKLGTGQHDVKFDTADSFTYVPNPALGPVRLRLVATLDIYILNLVSDLLEYRQVDVDGVLAWALVGKVPRPGTRDEYELMLSFQLGPDGRLVPRAFKVNGVIPGDTLSMRFGPNQVGPLMVVAPASEASCRGG